MLWVVLGLSGMGVSCSSGTATLSKTRTRSAEHLALIARGYRMEGDSPPATDLPVPDEESASGTIEEATVDVKQDKPGYSYWDESADDGGEPVSVEVDLSDQTAHFYRGGVKVGQSRVSTGKSGRETPTGTFTILEKAETKNSNLYGRIVDEFETVILADADVRDDDVPPNCKFVGARMPYWLRLTNSGVGMHAGIIPEPGTASSHGCIRLPLDMAEHLYRAAELGTKVTVVP
ncbi:MAG: L,D-transpeptidase family protein [Verrucomicrobiales bacterium]